MSARKKTRHLSDSSKKRSSDYNCKDEENSLGAPVSMLLHQFLSKMLLLALLLPLKRILHVQLVLKLPILLWNDLLVTKG